jgi:hypothetical protein
MKIRISDQSLRVRLSGQEGLMLEKGNALSASLTFSAIDQFIFELRTWNLTIGEVHLEKNKIIASIPATAAASLAHERGYCFTCEQLSDSEPALQLDIEIDLEKTTNS